MGGMVEFVVSDDQTLPYGIRQQRTTQEPPDHGPWLRSTGEPPADEQQAQERQPGHRRAEPVGDAASHREGHHQQHGQLGTEEQASEQHGRRTHHVCQRSCTDLKTEVAAGSAPGGEEVGGGRSGKMFLRFLASRLCAGVRSIDRQDPSAALGGIRNLPDARLRSDAGHLGNA